MIRKIPLLLAFLFALPAANAFAVSSGSAIAYLDWSTLSIEGDIDLQNSFMDAYAETYDGVNSTVHLFDTNQDAFNSYYSIATEGMVQTIGASGEFLETNTAVISKGKFLYGTVWTNFFQEFTAMSSGYVRFSVDYHILLSGNRDSDAELLDTDAFIIPSIYNATQSGFADDFTYYSLLNEAGGSFLSASIHRTGQATAGFYFDQGDTGYFNVFMGVSATSDGEFSPGDPKAFLYTTVPEPSSLMLLCAGLFMLGAMPRAMRAVKNPRA